MQQTISPLCAFGVATKSIQMPSENLRHSMEIASMGGARRSAWRTLKIQFKAINLRALFALIDA